MENYAIYTLFNDKHFDCGLTLLYSFFKFNKWFDGDFNIINDDKYIHLSEENRKIIKKISSHIKIIDVKSADYKKLFDNQLNSRLCYEDMVFCFYKLEAFRGLYEKILWLDGDILIMDSIKELFEDEKFNGKLCACVENGLCTYSYIKNSDNDYFNGGVYRFDKKFLKKYSFERLFDFCSTVTHNDFDISPRAANKGVCVDQDCLNYYIEDEDVLLIPSRIYNATQYLGQENCGNVKIFHYCGLPKPFERDRHEEKDKWFYDYWYELYDETSVFLSKDEGKVILNVIGTLGNFMFEMAAADEYARRTGRKLYYYTKDKYYDWDKIKFITDKFERIDALPEDCERYNYTDNSNFEEIPTFDTDKPVVLWGFFQNEKYFDKEHIFNLYEFNEKERQKILDKYGDLSDYVSVSVRHGQDYIKVGLAPDAEWYLKCMEKYFKGRKFFIASDDIEWCKENFKDIPNVVFADGTSVSQDLYACSLCQDHITYPGTFGWWGAWLGEQRLLKEGKESKIVITGAWDSISTIPKQWIIEG